MTSLGTYKPEFGPLIAIYAQLRVQYRILTERFEGDACAVSVDTAQGCEKKSPLVATLENLRKDILVAGLGGAFCAVRQRFKRFVTVRTSLVNI